MHPLRLLYRLMEWGLALPVLLFRVVVQGSTFNLRIGPLRHVVRAAIGFTIFAVLLVYVVAPLRGFVGARTIGDKLRYDSERWLATAVYDTTGAFVGTFDPRLDSRRDVNYTDNAIEMGDYVANPDHKSIPVREVPEMYWQCLVYHEDRYLGHWLNPYGIDLYGVLKIPYTTVRRTIALKRPSLGVGGSTLPMQFARVIYNTPPSASEGGITKLKRKFREWWLAPVIYHELTRGGDFTPLKQWAANHIWLAQRTGGQPLHGVEMTSRVVFGKEASKLSPAEQFVLASAVNKPIILLPGNDRLNEVRLDRWKYITEVRAQACAQKLIPDEAERTKVLFELVQMAGGPPDPRVKPRLQQALDQYAPTLAQRAQANPMIRANALLPAARFGIREEMKQAYGFGWREHVRGVTTTLDITDNLAFHERIKGELAKLDAKEHARLNPGYTLDPAKVAADRKLPSVVVVAANQKGEIVRYFESGESAPYFGSPFAREAATGRYDQRQEARHIASTGKMIAAIAIANEHRDGPNTLYSDPQAATGNGETCEKGSVQGARKSVVAFACSLNAPLITRAAQIGQEPIKRLVDGFGFAMPPTDANGERTPASTASVLGLLAGSPRRVHQMAGVVLASLTGEGGRPVRAPSLVRNFDYTHRDAPNLAQDTEATITPNKLIRPDSHAMLRTLLSAPLCHRVGGVAHGTLKGLAHWCADGRGDIRLHIAKTGTSTTTDPDATVDTWTAGGIQFANGAAYSYVVLVGTGTARETWARKMHASQANVPLVEALLQDLRELAKRNPAPTAQSAPQRATTTAAADRRANATTGRQDWRQAIFGGN